MDSTIPMIGLVTVLSIGMLMYVKSLNENMGKNMMKNDMLQRNYMIIDDIKSKLVKLQYNCSNKLMQNAGLINIQREMLNEVSGYFETLSNNLKGYENIFNNNGLISYGPVENTILVRVLNPDNVVSLMMLTDKLNVNKLNNQTYTDKLDIINSITTDINNTMLTTTTVTNTALLTDLKSKLDNLKTNYMSSITTNFNSMNSINRTLADKILGLDLKRYSIFMVFSFSNISSYNKEKYGFNISSFIDWTIQGKEGTDITALTPYIVDMTNGDIISAVSLSKVGNLKLDNSSLFIEGEDRIVLNEILEDLDLN